MIGSILFDEVPRVMIPVLICYVLIRILYLKKNNKKLISIEEIIKIAFVVYVCAIAAILVIPRFEFHISFNPFNIHCMLAYVPANEKSINLIPFSSISQQLSDWRLGLTSTHPFTNLIANCCLLLPMPIFIKLINMKMKGIHCLLITLAVIVFCEISQSFRAGRSCDIDDIILNFTGACIGLLLYYIIAYAVKRYQCKRKQQT